jgi:diguanylate cyclase (GGDEF)-like protein
LVVETLALSGYESRRLQALHQLHLMDTPAEERFDRITRLARRILNMPMAAIALVDARRRWFKSVQGFSASEPPCTHAFCERTVLRDRVLVVSDAASDERLAEETMEEGCFDIGFYAGVPLHTDDGSPVGTLCVMDRKSRHLDKNDTRALCDLAALVEHELQMVAINKARAALASELESARRRALIDPLTRLWNREGVMTFLKREYSRAQRDRLGVGLIFVDLDDFKMINDSYGHDAGDQVIREAASRMQAALRPYDTMGRYGGDEFLVVAPAVNQGNPAAVAERIRHRLVNTPISFAGAQITITASFGVARAEPRQTWGMEGLVRAADQALYRAKHAGRNCVETAHKPRWLQPGEAPIGKLGHHKASSPSPPLVGAE